MTKIHEANPYRNHYLEDIVDLTGQEVKLSGWVNKSRDHGGVMFIDLRDATGIAQLVFNVEEDSELYEAAKRLTRESTISVAGTVLDRSDGTINTEISTGKYEVKVTEMEILARAKEVMPFDQNGDANISEDIRLKHRYLDLRSDRMQKNIRMRSEIVNKIREEMVKQDFLEIHTPILTGSSPEGARDFIVPSRRHPGLFYALPQAPQQFKQLLMASGFERYFQIAPCFRDEDGRADRSPGEFYQLDMEMAFASQEDVFQVGEIMFDAVFGAFSDFARTQTPYPRITYAESMLKYGNDKPDLRNPLEIVDATELFVGSEFNAFADKTVRVIAVPGCASQSRSFFDSMEDFAKREGAKGLAWVKIEDGAMSGPIAKFLPEETQKALMDSTGAKDGDAIFFSAGDEKPAVRIAGVVRNELGEKLDLLEKDVFKFVWIVDYPMFEEEDGKIDFSHNPFSMPQGGMDAIENQDPLTIMAHQYDIVCNGYELCTGAVRNYSPELMVKAFAIAGYDEEVVKSKFPALYEAFQHGVPPHAGFAPGIDRIVMLLTGESLIRDVIAFPMTVGAKDLLMNAPNEVADAQLAEVFIESVPPESED